MRSTKDILELVRKLKSNKDSFMQDQKTVIRENMNISSYSIEYEKISKDEQLTCRYLQGKIDSIDDVLYMINN